MCLWEEFGSAGVMRDKLKETADVFFYVASGRGETARCYLCIRMGDPESNLYAARSWACSHVVMCHRYLWVALIRMLIDSTNMIHHNLLKKIWTFSSLYFWTLIGKIYRKVQSKREYDLKYKKVTTKNIFSFCKWNEGKKKGTPRQC